MYLKYYNIVCTYNYPQRAQCTEWCSTLVHCDRRPGPLCSFFILSLALSLFLFFFFFLMRPANNRLYFNRYSFAAVFGYSDDDDDDNIIITYTTL